MSPTTISSFIIIVVAGLRKSEMIVGFRQLGTRMSDAQLSDLCTALCVVVGVVVISRIACLFQTVIPIRTVNHLDRRNLGVVDLETFISGCFVALSLNDDLHPSAK